MGFTQSGSHFKGVFVLQPEDRRIPASSKNSLHWKNSHPFRSLFDLRSLLRRRRSKMRGFLRSSGGTYNNDTNHRTKHIYIYIYMYTCIHIYIYTHITLYIYIYISSNVQAAPDEVRPEGSRAFGPGAAAT